MPNAVIAHAPDGKFDLAALKREAAAWPGMIGLDLAKDVTCGQSYSSDETEWQWGTGYGRQEAPRFQSSPSITGSSATSCVCWQAQAAGSP